MLSKEREIGEIIVLELIFNNNTTMNIYYIPIHIRTSDVTDLFTGTMTVTQKHRDAQEWNSFFLMSPNLYILMFKIYFSIFQLHTLLMGICCTRLHLVTQSTICLSWLLQMSNSIRINVFFFNVLHIDECFALFYLRCTDGWSSAFKHVVLRTIACWPIFIFLPIKIHLC